MNKNMKQESDGSTKKTRKSSFLSKGAVFLGIVAVFGLVGTASYACKPKPVAKSGFEPYVDITLTGAQSVISNAVNNGVKTMSVAFLSGTAGCKSTIGGASASNYTDLINFIKSKEQSGTTFRISYGGAGGTDPSVWCTDATQMTALIKSDLQQFGSKYVDFDVEGGVEGNVQANQIRNESIKALRADGYKVSLTLAVSPDGFSQSVQGLLNGMAAAGARPDLVNIMTMDYGQYYDNQASLEKNSEKAVINARDQLAKTFNISASNATNMLEVTPMIGVNDDTAEVWTEASFNQFISFLRESGVSHISMWSLARDNNSTPIGSASPVGSGTNIANNFFQNAVLKQLKGGSSSTVKNKGVDVSNTDAPTASNIEK